MIAPPRTAERLLESLGADADFRETVLGDLAEEFLVRTGRDGTRAARLWYYRESARAVPHLLGNWVRHLRARDVAHLAGLVLTAYVFVLMLAGFAAAATYSVMEALGLTARLHVTLGREPLPVAARLALGATSALTGGFIAAWLNARAPLVSSLALGAIWACATLVAVARLGDVPAWYWLSAPIVVIASAAAGGVVRVCTQRARQAGPEVAP